MPTSASRELPVVIVTATSPSQYKVSYTAVSRGQYKLHIRINDKEMDGSPLNTTVYPDPNQLARRPIPLRVIRGLTTPYSIVFTSHGKMIVSEKVDDRIAIFDTEEKRVDKFESHGDSSKQILIPQGIAIDDDDNVYVSSQFKLQKFTSSGEFIDCVEKELNDPYGITLHENQLYVCDCNNHRIQVFDLDLKFIRSIGSHGKGKGQFRKPYDVKFDKDHNMYVAEYKSGRVQVLDKNGQFLRMFDKIEKLEDCQPSALHIIDKFVYVSDWNGGHIMVYETSGRFITSFGGWGPKRGKFLYPYCINTHKGQIYICDRDNGRIQIF